MIKGRCECSRVQYEVDGQILDLSHCHCSQCRRLHGAAFATFGEISRDKFRYLAGENNLKIYASSETNKRVFCSHCGSNILVDSKDEPDVLYIAMGTVDGDPECPPAYHAFAASKASWYEIDDHLPRYDTYPDD